MIFAVWFLRCLRLAVIGRVSPRRASDFLVATRKSPKKRPLPQRRLRRCPRSTHARRVASKLALAGSDIDATIPAGRGLHSALQKGKVCRLGFAIAGGVQCRCLRRGLRTRFVAPAQAGVQGF